LEDYSGGYPENLLPSDRAWREEITRGMMFSAECSLGITFGEESTNTTNDQGSVGNNAMKILIAFLPFSSWALLDSVRFGSTWIDGIDLLSGFSPDIVPRALLIISDISYNIDSHYN
jgi:hypothetical protein